MTQEVFTKEDYIEYDEKNYKKSKNFVFNIYSFTLIYIGLILSISLAGITTLNTIAFITLLITCGLPVLYVVFRLLHTIYLIDDKDYKDSKLSIFYFLNNMVMKSITYTDRNNVELEIKYKNKKSVLKDEHKKGNISKTDLKIYENYLQITENIPIEKQKAFIKRKLRIENIDKDENNIKISRFIGVVLPICLIFAYNGIFSKIFLFVILIYLASEILKAVNTSSRQLLFSFDYDTFATTLDNVSVDYHKIFDNNDFNGMLSSDIYVVYAFQYLIEQGNTVEDLEQDLKK